MAIDLSELKRAGSALRDFFNKDKDEEDIYSPKETPGESDYELEGSQVIFPAKKDDTVTTAEEEEEKRLEAEKVKTEAKKEEEESEADLEKRLKNINKVIDSFSGEVYKTPKLSDRGVDINVKPLDLSSVTSKQYLAPYYQDTGSQKDRIALLYENLRKYNLL
jgi:hypothetical protein